MMNDTPEEILRKQFEIVASKSLKEKIQNLFEMTELSRRIIQNRIRSNNPGISDTELQVETFKIFYRFDYDKRTLDQIANSIREYLDKKRNDTNV